MKTQKFKCTLLSDVILNIKSATEGPNQTLDFIPGSNFLGIAASQLYPQNDGDNNGKVTQEEAMTIFHSGMVRFGDAHPSFKGVRGLKVPSSMFYPKLKSPEEELYIHHLIPDNNDLNGIQLKQCRNGFYVFPLNDDENSSMAELVKTETSFAIKSAHDREKRRSKDQQLFGYQSLQKGLTMYFSVEFDNPEAGYIEKVKTALVGDKRIGRSRSAQYGLVRIEDVGDDGFREIEGEKSRVADKGSPVAVYADSRLIFLDGQHGFPTFRPTAEQLGLNGEIDWEKSQVRTFRYAPWNFKRQCFDTDRCGIEKGSVFVINLDKEADLTSKYVGSYRNEGFGRVIYNPSFLKADEKGKAAIRLNSNNTTGQKAKNNDGNNDGNNDIFNSPLLEYLRQRKSHINVYDIVNKWIDENQKQYEGKVTSSQWGNIRAIAQKSKGKSDLIEKLFKMSDKNNKADAGYLMHGSEEKQWNDARRKSLETFINGCDESCLKEAVVNLASQMSKK